MDFIGTKPYPLAVRAVMKPVTLDKPPHEKNQHFGFRCDLILTELHN